MSCSLLCYLLSYLPDGLVEYVLMGSFADVFWVPVQLG